MPTPAEVQRTVLDIMASQRRDAWKSPELKRAVMAKLGMSGDQEKDVRRAFAALEEQNYLAGEGNGSARQWRLLANGPAAAVRPSIDLSLALLKLRQLARHHLPNSVIGDLEGYFEGAARVLRANPIDSRSESALAWMGKTARLDAGYPLIPPTVDEQIFETIWAALYLDQTLFVRYQVAAREITQPKEYEVLPYAIVEKGSFWYLVVKHRRSSGKQGSPWLMRLDRMLAVENRGFVLKREPGFDLQAFIKEEKALEWFASTPEPLVLRVRERGSVPSQFRSVRLSDDQCITEEEGGFVLTATVAPSIALNNLLLERSPFVEVIAPASVRREIGKLLREAASLYADDGCNDGDGDDSAAVPTAAQPSPLGSVT